MTPEHPDYEKHRDFLLDFMKKQDRDETRIEKAKEKKHFGNTFKGKKYNSNIKTYSPKRFKK